MAVEDDDDLNWLTINGEDVTTMLVVSIYLITLMLVVIFFQSSYKDQSETSSFQTPLHDDSNYASRSVSKGRSQMPSTLAHSSTLHSPT
jgi:hypothetical protein